MQCTLYRGSVLLIDINTDLFFLNLMRMAKEIHSKTIISRRYIW